MTRMPDFEAEIRRDWHAAENAMRHLMHPHQQNVPQPAAAPTIATDTPEDPMSLLAEIENGAKALVDKLATVDHDALDALERVQANPGTAEAFQLLDQLTHLPVGEGVLTTAIAVLRMAAALPAAQPQPVAPAPAEPQAVPAGPVTGGVA